MPTAPGEAKKPSAPQRVAQRFTGNQPGQGAGAAAQGGDGVVFVQPVGQQAHGHLEGEGAEIIEEQAQQRVPRAGTDAPQEEERTGEVHREMGGGVDEKPCPGHTVPLPCFVL